MMRHLRRVSVALGSLGIVIVLAMVQTDLPSSFFGASTWSATAPLIVGIAVAHLAHVLEAPLQVGVFACAGPSAAVRTKVVAAGLQVSSTALGLLIFQSGVAGVYALALGSIAGLIVWGVSWQRVSLRATSGATRVEDL